MVAWVLLGECSPHIDTLMSKVDSKTYPRKLILKGFQLGRCPGETHQLELARISIVITESCETHNKHPSFVGKD